MTLLILASAVPCVLAQDAHPVTATITTPDVTAAALQLKKSARQSYQQGDAAAAREQLEATLSLYRQHRGDDQVTWGSRLAEVASEYLRAGETEQALAILGEAADLDLRLEGLSDAGLARASAALHRRLAALSADERFEMLNKWSMPAQSRGGVRVLSSITPTDAPPFVFARALGERPHRDAFAIPVVGEIRGLFSTAWELVKAAEQSGNLRRLGAEISALAEKQDRQAHLVDLLVGIVGAQRQDEELRASLIQRAASLREPTDSSPDDSDLVIAAACLTHDWLQPIGEDIFETWMERSAHLEAPRSFLCYAHATAARRRFGERSDDLVTGADLASWVVAGKSAAAQSNVRPMWLSHQNHILHLAGHGHDYLLFKYPLAGPFEFTCEAQAGGPDDSEGGVVYGGHGYEVRGADRNLILRDARGRESKTLPCPFVAATKHATFNKLSLRSTDRGVTCSANGHPTSTDTSNSGASPWLGLRAFGNRTAVFRQLRIIGNPVVPREVRLAADDSLRDWVVGGEKQDEWFAKGGVIHGQQVAGEDDIVSQSSIHYFRPLQNNESISYEFEYESGQLAVHPTLGRLAFLVEPGGVRLHWLTSGDSDWTGLSEDNAIAEPLERRGPKPLPLKSGDWNRVSVTLAGDTLKLSLNEVEIYSRKIVVGGDQTFGFYHDRTRSSARVRDVVLRGDWPAQLNAEQFENLTAVVARRTESQRRVLDKIFNDRHVPGAVLGVCEQAATRPPAQRYEFLSAWVLPNADHDTLRTAFDFTPTQPAPVARLVSIFPAAGQQRIAIGSDVVCPAIDLVQLAKAYGELGQLRQQVERAPTRTGGDLRSRATMLAVIDVAEADFIAANRNLDLLEKLLQSADFASFAEHWPETLVIREGVSHPEIREAAGDLAGYLLERLRAETVNGPESWERYIGSLAAQLKPLDPPQPAATLGEIADTSLALDNWSTVSYTTARTRGQGFPLANWQASTAQVDSRSGHHEDYLYFRVPLRGDFEVECELGGFGWRDTQLMVAGSWLGPLVDHVTYEVGNFRETQPPLEIEPRLPQTGEWIRQRTVVKDGVATTFLNGRRMREETLPPEHDPWLAIRSPFFGFGGARDIRITGAPQVPRQIRISEPADLPGWLPYFDETVGEEGHWQYVDELEGGGIVGSRRTDLPGSGLESLLRYHRPMLEDGSVEYDFYYSAGAAHVHPALDRRVFALDPAGVRIHWLTDGPHDRPKQDPFNLSEEPAHRRGPDGLPLKADSWNRLRLDLSRDTVRLTLNGQLVYECDLEPTNQRTFGLFHYADQTAARVRNIVWQGDWPRRLPPVGVQELADHRTDILDARLPELTAVFEHDFARDGFPLWRFHVYDAGWEENMEAKPDGLHMRRPCGHESVRFVVSPRMHVHGDFDAIAEYEQFVVASTSNGKWGISLRSVFDDKDTTLCSVFRGMVRRPGQLDQHIAIGEFTQWKPNGSTDIWYPGKVSEEAPYGRLRLARRGDKVHSFIAERDSPNFRHIHTERVTTERGRYDGIRLRAGAYSLVDEVGAASVVWKRLVVRAEDISNLPAEPIEEQEIDRD